MSDSPAATTYGEIQCLSVDISPALIISSVARRVCFGRCENRLSVREYRDVNKTLLPDPTR
jgi:hypothetical protein